MPRSPPGQALEGRRSIREAATTCASPHERETPPWLTKSPPLRAATPPTSCRRRPSRGRRRRRVPCRLAGKPSSPGTCPPSRSSKRSTSLERPRISLDPLARARDRSRRQPRRRARARAAGLGRARAARRRAPQAAWPYACEQEEGQPMTSPALVDLFDRIGTNTLTTGQQAALQTALGLILPDFPEPDEISNSIPPTEAALARAWIAALYTLQAEAGGPPVPNVVTGTTIVANPAALSALPDASLPDGAPANVLPPVGAEYFLDRGSTEAPNGITVLPTQSGAGRWIRGDTLIGPEALATPAWFVSPVAGSDSNVGTDSAHALKSIAEIGRRYGTTTPILAAGVTINVDDGGAPWPSTDPWPFRAQTGDAGFLVVGALRPAVASGTIGVFTARNNATATPAHITASGAPAGFWSTLVGALVHDVTKDCWFFVFKDLGAAAAAISESLSGATTFAPPQVTPVNGDAFQVFRPSTLELDLTAAEGVFGDTFQTITVQSAEAVTLIDGIVAFDRCSFAGTGIAIGTASSVTTFANCYQPGSWQGPGLFFGGVAAGASSNFSGAAAQFTTLDGFIIVATTSNHCLGLMNLCTVMFQGAGGLFDRDSGPSFFAAVPGNYGGPIVSVPAGAGFDVGNGSQLGIQGDATVVFPGGGTLSIDGVASGYPWTGGGTHAFGAAVATTQANVNANTNLQNPQTGARIYIRT